MRRQLYVDHSQSCQKKHQYFIKLVEFIKKLIQSHVEIALLLNSPYLQISLRLLMFIQIGSMHAMLQQKLMVNSKNSPNHRRDHQMREVLAHFEAFHLEGMMRSMSDAIMIRAPPAVVITHVFQRQSMTMTIN